MDPEAMTETGEGAAQVVEDKEFDPVECLFCNQRADGLENNVDHMRKKHGLFIPTDHLMVEVETLLAYMHLVIFGYSECLYCGMQRQTAEGVRQHMMDRGHCAIDLLSPESEYRDFYEFGSDEEGKSAGEVSEDAEDAEDAENIATTKTATPSIVQITDGTARLRSGKLLSHRSSRATPRLHKRRAATEEDASQPQLEADATAPPSTESDDAIATSSKTLTRAAKRDARTASHMLTHLRAEDRRSLMHLSSAQQRAVLATQRKEIASARRSQRAMQGRVESMGNKTLMMHFVNDVPGRLNG